MSTVIFSDNADGCVNKKISNVYVSNETFRRPILIFRSSYLEVTFENWKHYVKFWAIPWKIHGDAQFIFEHVTLLKKCLHRCAHFYSGLKSIGIYKISCLPANFCWWSDIAIYIFMKLEFFAIVGFCYS